jgi:hypothetical protein
VYQVFRLFHGENDFLKKRILLDAVASSARGHTAGWRHAAAAAGAP